MPKAAKARAVTSRAGELSSSAGFSLTELLVVLALIALASAVAAGAIRTGRGAQSTRVIAAELASALRQARVQAISGAGPQRVTVDLTARQYTASGSKRAKSLPDDMQIVVRTITGETLGEKQASIRFNEDGTSSGGEIVIARGGQSWIVAIEWLTGNVTVRELGFSYAGG